MKKVVYLLLIFTIISCSKNDDIVEESFTVTLSSVITGTLNDSSKIEYRDASGSLKTEDLTVGTWNKTFNVIKPFKLFVKASGTINGSLVLKASANGNDVDFKDTRNLSANIDSVFEVEISSDL